MKARFVALSAAAAVLAALPAPARAGGFMHYEHSALATGMVNARTALWDDPSSLFYNPAAISLLHGYQLSLGDTFIRPSVTYTPLPESERDHPVDPDLDGTRPSATHDHVFFPVHFYGTFELTDFLDLGVSLNNPFGLGTFWPADWDGRFTAFQTNLETYFAQASLALDISRLAHLDPDLHLAVAASGQYVYSNALIRQKLDFIPLGEEPIMELTGTAHSGGYGVSAFFAWLPWVSVGASVRSNVVLEYEGTAKFTHLSAGLRNGLAAMGLVLPESSPGGTTIELPWNMNVGVAFHGIPNLTIAVDVYAAFWQSYDELRVEFGCARTDPPTCWNELASDDRTLFPKNWHASVQAGLGLEYRPFEALALRAGYGYVTDPTDPAYYDAMLPDGDRHLVTFGLGVRTPWLVKFDLGYMLAMWDGVKNNGVGDPQPPLARNGTANGTYETVTHILALTLGLAFDADGVAPPQSLDQDPSGFAWNATPAFR